MRKFQITIIKCLQCKEEALAKYKTKKFCSLKCCDAYRYKPSPRKLTFIICTRCKKRKQVRPGSLLKYKIRFCSKECNILYMKENAFRLNCKVCDKVFFCQPVQLKLRNRATCSMECGGKMRTMKAKINREKKGMTKHQIDRSIRYSKEAEDWRIAVFARDNYTCQMCFERGNYLEADHIKPWAFFPELRFELSNGRTLCRPCHDTTKISAKAMRELYL